MANWEKGNIEECRRDLEIKGNTKWRKERNLKCVLKKEIAGIF
jgi:hypothetical protein